MDALCCTLWGVHSKLCAGAEQCSELSHEANRMTDVNMTEGSQRHTCRNGKG